MRAAELFPELYRKSWRLTRIVAVYLVGQILQSDATLKAILDEPEEQRSMIARSSIAISTSR